MIGTIYYQDHPWIDEFKQRGDVELIMLTVENRDRLADELIEQIHKGDYYGHNDET